MIDKLKLAVQNVECDSAGRYLIDRSSVSIIIQQLEQADRMREALMYYAKEHKIPNDGPWGRCSDDYGDVARAALSQEKGDDLHVGLFSQAMKRKLRAKRNQGRGGWDNPAVCSQEMLSRMLREHVEKGDPVDVANFCMMLHQRGEAIL